MILSTGVVIVFVIAFLIGIVGTFAVWMEAKESRDPEVWMFMILVALVAGIFLATGFMINNENVHKYNFVHKIETRYKVDVVGYSRRDDWVSFEKEGKTCSVETVKSDQKALLKLKTLDCQEPEKNLDEKLDKLLENS